MNFEIYLTQATNNATSSAENLLLSSELAALLSIVALVACVICIVLVIYWGRRLQESAFQRSSLVEALATQEADLLIGELADRVYYEPIDYLENPLKGVAAKFKPRYFWDNKNYVLSYDPAKDVFKAPPGESDAYIKQLRADHESQKEAMIKFKEWAEEEERLFEKEKRKIKEKALKRADKRIPKSMDISLLGGGFSFILEFSTVIVIIFSVVILGIVGILEGREISTILAAIAGYVLGKATGFLPSSKEQAPPEQQKIEELGKKIEEQEEKIEKQSKLIKEQKKKSTG